MSLERFLQKMPKTTIRTQTTAAATVVVVVVSDGDDVMVLETPYSFYISFFPYLLLSE